MLEIKNYTKSYVKGSNVVEDLSLKVEKGDIYAFVGHNGAGKTTTIKSIVGILDFEKGDILIDNKSIKKHEIECKMKMAYIPDNPDLYEHLKGISYLNFIADIYRVSKEFLDNGADYCVLFTDDSNPISNHVYEKIGYERKVDITDIDFI